MRVVVVSFNPFLRMNAGGVWNLVHSRNLALVRSGCDVVMLCGFALAGQSPVHLTSNTAYPIEVFTTPVANRVLVQPHLVAVRQLAPDIVRRVKELSPDMVVFVGDHGLPSVLRGLPPNTAAVIDIQGSLRESLDAPRNSAARLASYMYHVSLARRWYPRLKAALVVTDHLGNECKRYAPKLPTFTVPCACLYRPPWEQVCGDRQEWRQSLGMAAAELLLVHSGTLEFYADPRPMAELLGALMSRGLIARLLLATYSLERASAFAASLPTPLRDRVIFRNFPNGEHLSVLAAADVGLLLRDDLATNWAAFPNKADEYWSVGVPVVTTPGLRAIAALVREKAEMGIVIPYSPPVIDSNTLAWFKDRCGESEESRSRRFESLKIGRQSIAFETTLAPFLDYFDKRRRATLASSPPGGH